MLKVAGSSWFVFLFARKDKYSAYRADDWVLTMAPLGSTYDHTHVKNCITFHAESTRECERIARIDSCTVCSATEEQL